jgi:hypothetical protein
MTASLIDIAVRAYTVPRSQPVPKPTLDEKRRRRKRRRRSSDLYLPVIIVDTETRSTAALELMLGAYRVCVWRGKRRKRLVCLEEGLIYADDLTGEEMQILKRYWWSQLLDTAADPSDAGSAPTLRLRSESQFRELLYDATYKHGAGSFVLVGQNIDFDISRFALDWSPASAKVRGSGRWSRFQNGWSYRVHQGYEDAHGWHESPHHPRYLSKHLSSTKAFRGWAAPFTNPPIDLRQFAFALTAKGHSLQSGPEAFEILMPEHLRPPAEHYNPRQPDPKKRYGYRKAKVPYGKVSPELISYCREDVDASQRWDEAMVLEWAKHPIAGSPQYLYSPATIAKAYLRAAGIRPRLELQPDFPIEQLGIAMSAFFGARTECNIRKVLVPVRYCDLLSAYPTACTRMGLWWYMIAARVDLVDDTAAVRDLVAGVDLQQVLSPELWPQLPAFVLIEPQGDVLPVRGRYDKLQWNIGVNHVWSEQPLWYALPDVIASKIITGRAPKILRALRLRREGIQDGMRPMNLRGEVLIDPRTEDFFKAVIERRHELPDKNSPLGQFLKIMVNAGSYGIWAQFDRRETPDTERVTIADGSRDPWTLDTNTPEAPGDYCFPVFAAPITSATRLLLAICERLVTDLDGGSGRDRPELGGTWAMMDTDSIGIVSSEHGGLVPCPGGPHVDRAGRECVKALTWDQVRDEVQEPMRALNPYDGEAGKKQIFELEDENYALDEHGKKTDAQQELHCYAIASKRYALVNLEGDQLQLRRVPGQSTGRENPVADEDLDPATIELHYQPSNVDIRKRSDHSLGGIINPDDPDNESRDWIAPGWHWSICRELGIPCEEPPWVDRPKLMRGATTTPALLERFRRYNTSKAKRHQMRPMNFFMAAEPKPIDPEDWEYLTEGLTKDPFTLIAPFESDPNQWADLDWIHYQNPDNYLYHLADSYQAAYDLGHLVRGRPEHIRYAAAKTLRDTFKRYMRHPETTMLGPDGRVCREDTVGLLSRRQLEVSSLSSTGKGINAHEERLIGLRPTEPEHRNTYTHPDQIQEQAELTRQALDTLGDTILAIARRTNLSTRTIKRFRASVPTPIGRPAGNVLNVLTAHACQRAYDVLPSRGFDRDELKRMSTIALLKTLIRHAQRVCAMSDCDQLARPKSAYCSDACKQAAWKPTKRTPQAAM